jgi:PhnB protein
MHVSLPLGKTILMGTDSPDSMQYKLITGNNFYVSISTESREETDRIYNGLSSGGQKEMPLQDTFWGAYFGMLCDKFGIHWMVGYDKNRKVEY